MVDSNLPCQSKLTWSNYQFPVSALGSKPVIFQVEGARPRWWYIAAASCGAETGKMKFSYSFNFTNEESAIVQREFGKDEQGRQEFCCQFKTFLQAFLRPPYFLSLFFYS